MLKRKLKKINKLNYKMELLEKEVNSLESQIAIKVAKKLKISYHFLMAEQVPYSDMLSIAISFYGVDYIEFKTIYVDYENGKMKIIDFDKE